jgi:hypothetical protein
VLRGSRRPAAMACGGGSTASVACEQGPASAFMGEQGEGEGNGRGQGGSGSSGSGSALGRTRLSPSVACAAERGVSEGGN